MKVTVKGVKNLAVKLEDIKLRLEAMVDSKNETLNNTNAAQYPNEKRIEALENQIYILQTAFDDLDNLISGLEEYE